MTKKNSWKKELPEAARKLLAARAREHNADRPKAFPSSDVAARGTAAYVKKFCKLNNLIL